MSVFAQSVSSLWRQIEDYGIDPVALFTKHGACSGKMLDPNARYKFQKVDGIMAEAATLSGDPFFGLKEAEYLLPTHIGPLGFAWLASKNLHAALDRLHRFSRLISATSQVELDEVGSDLLVSFDVGSPSKNAYQRDSANLALLTKMCRLIHSEDWHPTKVSIIHAEPEDTSYFYAYFRCPVEFSAKQNGLYVNKQEADAQLTGSNDQLAQLNDHIVVRYLASIDRDDIINQTKVAIMERLGEGGVTENCVADTLFMSTRSLNRKLSAEDSSFKSLLMEIRTELADQYINDPTLTLTEISYMLGFSEVSSFSRAYRRWTGESPSSARKHRHVNQ